MMTVKTTILFLRCKLVVLFLLAHVESSSSFSAAAPRHNNWSWDEEHSSYSHCSVPCGILLRLPSSKILFRERNIRQSASCYWGSLQKLSQSSTNFATELEVGESGYPVQITHQGQTATIFVRKNETILHALERQSTTSSNNISVHSHSLDARRLEGRSEMEKQQSQSSLALSDIPSECRRGNCLTCSARLVSTNHDQDNIHANVDNGLSPTIDTELTQLGYILTCCSFVTGPGVTLELDQNNNAWDAVYRRRICNNELMQLGMEAQARLLRRVDEENVGRWKRRTEKALLDGNNNVEPDDVF